MKASVYLCLALALGAPAHAAEPASSAELAAPRFGVWGFDLSGRDTAANPGDDFFRYANGGYLDRMVIPPDRTRYGMFDELRVLSEQRVRNILEADSASNESKSGAFYKSYMDEAAIERRGIAPLQADLARVQAAKTHEDIAALMGDRRLGAGSIFYVGIGSDDKNPDRYAVYSYSGGMSLPDRDYYLKASFSPTKAKYESYIAQMLGLAGWPNAAERAAEIVQLETKFAEASWPRTELRNRDKTYNPVSFSQLKNAAAGFDFQRFMAAADLKGVDRIIVGDNTAFPEKAALFKAAPVSLLKAWLAFNIIDSTASYLPKRFVDARFAFRDKALSGQPELASRWKRAVDATNGVLGQAVGREYVRRYFPPESKRQMQELVDNLKSAFAVRIERVTWMSAETKRQALEKLSKFGVKIGYPDKWRDYDALRVDADDLYGNIKNATIFEWRRDLARLDQPVDRTEWGMLPHTVNAYYSSNMNEIVFPAGILQPPFFYPEADPAVNYGAIGGVIGHEVSHGFDDQGRKSDGEGRLRDWWTPEDAAKFDARADRLGAQYSAFELLPGEFINGRLTMGENIGDLGGVNIALEAYRISLRGKTAPVLDGTTGEQRVFLAWAQVWRGKSRDETLRQQLYTDEHSPVKARVNGVMRNIDAWYDAFGIKPGDKLYVAPSDRVYIW